MSGHILEFLIGLFYLLKLKIDKIIIFIFPFIDYYYNFQTNTLLSEITGNIQRKVFSKLLTILTR